MNGERTPGWITKGFVAMAIIQAVLMGGGAYTLLETRTLTEDNQQGAELDEARRCVTSWESRRQIREAIAVPGEAIIEAIPRIDPEVVRVFRESVQRQVLAIYPDPTCDLEAARARVREG